MTAAHRRTTEPRPVFTLKIEGKPGPAGIHALRAVLKILLRRYVLRAVDIRESDEQEERSS
jgi:hypothetical protein